MFQDTVYTKNIDESGEGWKLVEKINVEKIENLAASRGRERFINQEGHNEEKYWPLAEQPKSNL
ncbi:unnamed protein product [Acanthoscelides obtectus]|uniref:Uncharacterized protein n=1 Tax=Acanthoscelides obtectus TaxID=200917 RepID=A0A9P0PME6_ACAOB|nr:unnamed protein product [Acanthoscelides obtectus]CAK1637577.1 hypothetical protein AOBTE_LOCUS10065 [Acanthoscelides obtectus]